MKPERIPQSRTLKRAALDRIRVYELHLYVCNTQQLLAAWIMPTNPRYRAQHYSRVLDRDVHRRIFASALDSHHVSRIYLDWELRRAAVNTSGKPIGYMRILSKEMNADSHKSL